jgi:SAM-dependent methyltransferase
MNHADHVRLLRDGIPAVGGVWADLGSGTGAFTLALADLLGADGTIYSVDRDQGALRAQEQAMRARFPAVTVHYRVADFTRPLDVPPLDGIVMANALHFVGPRHKVAVIRQIKGYLRPGGRLLVVEYNVDSGNLWVPHPFAYPTWERLARDSGFAHTQLLATAPSRFLTGFYSAASW